MHVATDDVALVRHRGFVREDERWLRQRSVDASDVDLGAGIAGALVVVASHEDHLDRCVATPPLGHDARRLGLTPLTGVEEVTEEDDARCAGAGERRVEPRE